MRKIIELFRKISVFLRFPFIRELKFFIIILIISSIVDIVVYAYTASLLKAAFIGLHHYLVCYFLTLVLWVLPHKIKSIYKAVVLLLVGLNFLIDFVCIYSFHSVFSEYFVSIFSNTNFNEIIEFIQTYVSPFQIAAFGLFFILLYFFYRKILKPAHCSLGKKASFLGLGGVIVGMVCIPFVSTKNVGNISIIKYYTILKDTPPDLKSYMANPELVISKKDHPRKLVLIIGESFAKSHCSLYDYAKQTNPLLKSLKDSNLLYLFNDVVSPAVNTVPAFKCIMSTYKPELKDSVDWFKCITLNEILNKVGYETYWFSNQNRNGMWDNVVTQYASLSNFVYFNGEKFAVKNKTDLDGDLIPLIKKYGQLDKDVKKVYIVHLMGSHHDFNKRYPKGNDRFKTQDYLEYPEMQRQKLAEYDNSVLYNDSVIYELIKLFDTGESIVFYFPDHGLDVYESRDDYVGHAIHNNKMSIKVASDIPFMVYMNEAFQTRFPDLSRQLKENVNTPFRTDDFIYTVMDLLGIKFQQNKDVEKYSLLR